MAFNSYTLEKIKWPAYVTIFFSRLQMTRGIESKGEKARQEKFVGSDSSQRGHDNWQADKADKRQRRGLP